MNAPSIAPLIAASLAVAALGCSALEEVKAAALVEKVEAGLEAKLEVLSNEKNLERIEQIADAILKADATRKVALQGRVKTAVAEAGAKAGDERTGGAELRLFFDRHDL